MAFASITLTSPAGLNITIDRPDGGMLSPDANTGALLPESDGWGVDGSGNAYFNAGGALPGQEGVLSYDGSNLIVVGAGNTIGSFANWSYTLA
jgi:hypothetical protein